MLTLQELIDQAGKEFPGVPLSKIGVIAEFTESGDTEGGLYEYEITIKQN